MGYATLTDLNNCGLPNGALASVSDDVKQQALDDRSAYADSFLGDKVQLPLNPPFDRTLVRMVCFLASWDLLCFRGFNPDNPADTIMRTRHDDANVWLLRVSNGQARIIANETPPPSLQPDTSTNPTRGYGELGLGGTDDPFTSSSGGWGM